MGVAFLLGKWAATWQNQQNECAPNEDSDQPGHPPSLIRVFAIRMKKASVLSYPLSAQRRLWSDWTDAQTDLSLRWAHSHFVGFFMSRFKYFWEGNSRINNCFSSPFVHSKAELNRLELQFTLFFSSFCFDNYTCTSKQYIPFWSSCWTITSLWIHINLVNSKRNDKNYEGSIWVTMLLKNHDY